MSSEDDIGTFLAGSKGMSAILTTLVSSFLFMLGAAETCQSFLAESNAHWSPTDSWAQEHLFACTDTSRRAADGWFIRLPWDHCLGFRRDSYVTVNIRPEWFAMRDALCIPDSAIFRDGFESGDTSRWR